MWHLEPQLSYARNIFSFTYPSEDLSLLLQLDLFKNRAPPHGLTVLILLLNRDTIDVINSGHIPK